MAFIDMAGWRFGKLLVLDRAPNNARGTSMWNCLCDCGERRLIEGTGLRAGRNKSCGCASPRFECSRFKKHGMSGTRTYSIWRGMHTRCTDPKASKAHLYVLKGIKVCERWNDFENFLADMGVAPDGLTIDRIDGDRGYEPGNCRWADRITQGNNTSANHKLTINGRTQTISMWAREIGMKSNTIVYRIRRGWDAEKALTTPVISRING